MDSSLEKLLSQVINVKIFRITNIGKQVFIV